MSPTQVAGSGGRGRGVRRLLGALALLAALPAAGRAAETARAPAEPCAAGVPRDAAERLFAILNRQPADAPCRFEGVRAGATLEARWSRDGVPLPPLSVAPRECAAPGGRRAGLFVVHVPPQIAASCPSVAALIDAAVRQLEEEEPSGGDVGSVRDPLYRGARALFVAVAAVGLALLARGAPSLRRLDRRWAGLGLAGFAAALALRAALPFSLGNWYVEVLPAAGSPPGMRFGPGAIALQSLLRDAGMWNRPMLVLSQLLIGAAAVPLLAGVLWELRVGLPAAAAAVVLCVFAPFHARLSASAGEHVLAATLCLALLLAWLRAARTRDRLWLALAVLLFPAVCATRVDMAVQATLVLLWPLCRDRIELSPPPAPARQPGMAAGQLLLLAIVAAATLALSYRFIVLPARHPMPELAGQLQALRGSLRQFWLLATDAPGWISLSAVLLAALGVPAMLLRRPLLLVRIGVTLVVAFGASGRLFLPDELLAARYFLFTIPLLLIVAGHGFAALLVPVPRPYRAGAATIGLIGLALWTGLAARRAYAVRYAFQDEYSFARRALAALPDDCAVYQVPVRSAHFPLDLDCCLDLRRSPLPLEFPRLRFRYLPDEPPPADGEAGCAAYYEGIACALPAHAPTDGAARERLARAAPYLRARCAAARAGRLELLAETTTSPRATVDFFHGTPPRAALYRRR